MEHRAGKALLTRHIPRKRAAGLCHPEKGIAQEGQRKAGGRFPQPSRSSSLLSGGSSWAQIRVLPRWSHPPETPAGALAAPAPGGGCTPPPSRAAPLWGDGRRMGTDSWKNNRQLGEGLQTDKPERSLFLLLTRNRQIFRSHVHTNQSGHRWFSQGLFNPVRHEAG